MMLFLCNELLLFVYRVVLTVASILNKLMRLFHNSDFQAYKRILTKPMGLPICRLCL